jgi:two-component system, cell cycle sensor histidine kinase and response regulator CckA
MTGQALLYRILNVNDNAESRRYKTQILTDAGFEVVEATRASDALRQAMTDPPDLVLLDVNLPDGNGVDVCREMQPPLESADTFEGDRPYAIVLISANVTKPEDIARGMSAGADAYLVEPLDDAYLVGLIHALVERHARRRWAAAERAALRVRDFRYRILAATVGDTIYDWDLTTDHVEFSDAVYRMLRYRPELVGETSQWWVDHIHPEDRGRVMTELHRVFVEGQPTHEIEYRFARSDGSYAVVVDRATLIFDEQGRPLRAIGAMSDITERRRLADQLRLSQKMEAVGQLAGGIAHDFNNVLTSVMGFAGMLKYELKDQPNALEYAGEIETAATRAADLIGQLLSFSRRQVLKAEVLDINHVVKDSTRMLQRLIGAHIEVQERLTTPLPSVRVDRAQLDQVLMNLVVNARDAMPNGGIITLGTTVQEVTRSTRDARAMPRGRYVKLSVSDTGVGMDDTTRSRIFEPFFTTKERGRGTGLGLATVYGIVKQNGGFIWATSVLGSGSTFDIFLPALDIEPTAGRAPNEPQSDIEPAAQGETILVVEDEDGVRRLALQVLTRAGYRVLEAADGPEALALAAQFKGRIHLLLTDVVLPGLSGIVVADRLKHEREDMRILYMSGYSAETHGPELAAAGAPPLLPKPFSRDQLLKEVARVLRAVPAST